MAEEEMVKKMCVKGCGRRAEPLSLYCNKHQPPSASKRPTIATNVTRNTPRRQPGGR